MSFREYVEHGWRLCPILPGNKGPTGEFAIGWSKRENAISDPARAATLPGAGLCHAWSGTCAIDVDDYGLARSWLAERGIDLDALMLASDSVQISSGRQNRGKLIYRLDSPLASVKVGPYKKKHPETGREQTYHALELRCATANGVTVQDVLPPTIHPMTGKPYEWMYGDALIGHWSNLPALPDALREVWKAQLAPQQDALASSAAPIGADHREIAELLAGLDPDMPYDEWINIGMAVHHETRGSLAGFGLWDNWSAKGSKYKGTADLRKHWASFRSDAANPKTLGTLRARAVAKIEAFPLSEPEAAPPPVENSAPKTESSTPKKARERARELLESRLVFVTGQDNYYDIGGPNGVWLTDRAIKHLYCPHMPTEVIPGEEGAPTQHKVIDPVELLKRSRTKKVVDAVGLHPGAGRFYSEDGLRYVNAYSTQPIESLRPKPHELEAFEFMWSRLRDPVFRQWLLMFYAHAVQKPGVKIQSAPLLFSDETGTGKNTIAHVVPSLLFGSRWVRSMSGNVLHSQFNDALGEAWWLYLEELRSGTTKVDRMHIANKIKSWVTDTMIEIHPKGRKPYDIRNRIQITATSNFSDALQIDNNDRRWAICELGRSLTERESMDLYSFLHSERAPGVLHHIFRGVNLTGFRPTSRAPVTKGRTVMIRSGLGSWESSIVEAMVSASRPFDRDVFRLKDVYEALLGHGPATMHQLADLLKKSPFFCRPLRRTTSERLWAWRNIELWDAQTETARVRHIETASRPHGFPWSADIPTPILAMSADTAVEAHDCTDLL